MANRNILHRSKLDEFKAWLGNRSLPPCGKWELVRWKGGSGQPMRIVFDNVKSCEHLSCNDVALKDVRAFVEERKISEDSCTQPTVNQQRKAGFEDCAQIAALLDSIDLSLLESYTLKETADKIRKARQLLPC